MVKAVGVCHWKFLECGRLYKENDRSQLQPQKRMNLREKEKIWKVQMKMPANDATCTHTYSTGCVTRCEEEISLIFVSWALLSIFFLFAIIKISFKITKPFTKFRPNCASVMYFQQLSWLKPVQYQFRQ